MLQLIEWLWEYVVIIASFAWHRGDLCLAANFSSSRQSMYERLPNQAKCNQFLTNKNVSLSSFHISFKRYRSIWFEYRNMFFPLCDCFGLISCETFLIDSNKYKISNFFRFLLSIWVSIGSSEQKETEQYEEKINNQYGRS